MCVEGLFDDRLAHWLRGGAGSHPARDDQRAVAVHLQPTSISQVAAEAALNGDQGCITPMLDAFKGRHRYIVDALNAIPGFKCVDSGGAFYAFPDVRDAIMNLLARDVIEQPTDIAFSEYLLESADVAVVPGSAFGAEGYIRLSFATSQANLEKALSRIAAALA